MIVEIVKDKDKTNPTKGKDVRRIEFDGNIVFPYYLTLMSIEHHTDKLVFRILKDYTTKFSADGKKLWIMGDKISDENTVNRFEGIME